MIQTHVGHVGLHGGIARRSEQQLRGLNGDERLTRSSRRYSADGDLEDHLERQLDLPGRARAHLARVLIGEGRQPRLIAERLQPHGRFFLSVSAAGAG